jgi:hypothetical protein
VSGVVLLLVVLVFVVLKYLGTLSPWKLTHWLFSYELGFVKRGLVGTLLRAGLPREVVTVESVVVVSLIIAAVFVVALYLLALPLLVEEGRQRSGLIALAALLAPGIGYLLSDLGRFDVLIVALCLLTILAARRMGRFPHALFLAVACLLVLIHEAAIVLAVPMLFVAHLHGSGRLQAVADPRQWPALALRVAAPVLVCAAVTLFGRSDLALADLLGTLAAHADFTPLPRSAYVLVRTVDSNFAQVLGGQAGGEAPEISLGTVDMLQFGMILGVAGLQQVLGHLSFQPLDRERRLPILTALHLSFAAPFVLLIVGIDWGRWVALASAQCAVLMLLFARDLPLSSEAPVPRRFAALALAFVVLAAGSGYRMHGVRRPGMLTSPQANVLSWVSDTQRSTAWHQAFVVPQVR